MKIWFTVQGVEVRKNCRLDRVIGRMCTLRQSLSNESFKAREGTRMRIIGDDRRGWALSLTEPCECCGLTGRIYSVPWEAVAVDGPVPAPPTKSALEAAKLLGGEEAADELVKQWERKRYWYEKD